MGNCRDFGFRDQMQRAAVSVMSNLAEGFERGTNKEFLHFLTIARGSVAEVRSLSYTGLDQGYLSTQAQAAILNNTKKIMALLNGFMSYLRKAQRQR